MQKAIVPIVTVVAVVGLLVAISSGGDTTTPLATTTGSHSAPGEATTVSTSPIVDFSTDELAAAPDDQKNLLFFHAEWCTICKSIERNIDAGSLPDDITVFRVDYDNDIELLEKYDVNFQSAFVQIDKDGNEITSWQGQFGDDIDDILENVQTL